MTENEHIVEIIKKTFSGHQKRLSRRYSKQYNGGETHISEQELRFTFVEQFNKGWFYKYLYISSEVIRKRPCKLSYFVRRSHVLRSKNTRTSFEGR